MRQNTCHRVILVDYWTTRDELLLSRICPILLHSRYSKRNQCIFVCRWCGPLRVGCRFVLLIEGFLGMMRLRIVSILLSGAMCCVCARIPRISCSRWKMLSISSLISLTNSETLLICHSDLLSSRSCLCKFLWTGLYVQHGLSRWMGPLMLHLLYVRGIPRPSHNRNLALLL